MSSTAARAMQKDTVSEKQKGKIVFIFHYEYLCIYVAYAHEWRYPLRTEASGPPDRVRI